MSKGAGPQVLNYESSPGVFGSYSLGPWASTRIRMTRYPSPFLDYSSMELPKTAEDTLYWCAFFAITNPLIRAAISRKSAHPITPLVIRHPSPPLEQKWRSVFSLLGFQEFLRQCITARNVYGRSAFSVFPAFRKYLICASCGKHFLYEAVNSRLNARERQFYCKCPNCMSEEKARPVDMQLSMSHGVTLRRWGPLELQREKRAFSGYDYYVKLPVWTANKIRLGDPKAIANTPQELIDAILAERRFRLFPERVHVMIEPEAVEPPVVPSDGFPFGTMAAVLKDVYGLTVAMKYEEVCLFTEMIQFRGLAPVATGDPATDVFLSGGLEKWQDLAREEYKKFLGDPGYMPVFPVPMSYVQLPPGIGPLLPTDQVKLKISRICSGLHVPEGLIFEGSNYSGANMALRLFENDAARSQDEYVASAEFTARELSRILGVDVPSEIQARPFLSADAIQQLGAYSQMVGSGQISRAHLHEKGLGVDHDEMERQLEEENRQAIQRQIENNRVTQEANTRLQQSMPQPPPQPAQPQQMPPGTEQVPGEIPPQGGPPEAAQYDEFGQPIGPDGYPVQQVPQQVMPPQPGQQMIPEFAGPGGQMAPGMIPPGGASAALPTSTGLPSLPQVGGASTPTGMPSMAQVTRSSAAVPQEATLEQLIPQIEPEGVNPTLLFSVTQALRGKVPLERAMYMRQISDRNPRFYSAVLREFSPISESAARPLPEQLPPRRLDKVV